MGAFLENRIRTRCYGRPRSRWRGCTGIEARTSIRGWLVLAGIALLLAACGTEDPEDLSIDLDDQQATVAVAEFAGVDQADPVTVDAERVTPAYVGAVDEDLFIAVVLDGAQDEITVYLCDGTSIEDMAISEWLTGEVRDGGAASLGDGVSPRVEVQIHDDAVVGTVATWGAQPRTFTARPASGEAGLYRADQAIELDADQVDDDSALAVRERLTDPDRQAMLRGGWIVLQDGRQRGAVILYATPSPN